MKETKSKVQLYLSYRRHTKNLKRRRLKKRFNVKYHLQHLRLKKNFGGKVTYEKILEKWLPSNLAYLLSNDKSDFHASKLSFNIPKNNGIFKVPKEFSIVDFPNESYEFIRQVTGALIFQRFKQIKIDYRDCKRIDIGAHVLLDIILKDVIKFFRRCQQNHSTVPKVNNIGGININHADIHKFLFSVGSPAIHSKQKLHFDDIIPYNLCIHNRESNRDPIKIIEQKDIDTTTLVDYVIDSLARMNKTLTQEKLEDLCTVIGEILINAEEHATTKYRFSIGYFHEHNENGKHFGVLRLAILNFGKTIYETFKDPLCPNKEMVQKMKALSESYNYRKLFDRKTFEEETLWTLYALQEGVTSIPSNIYRKRGNGSIQFIESFFNIKGQNRKSDNVSRMVILSGNTKINFDGTYNIVENNVDGENFKFMTFNNSGKMENKPDSKYVNFVDNYFPGTMISAKILFNEDDLQHET